MFASVYTKEMLRWFYWGPMRMAAGLVPRGLSYSLVERVGRFYCRLSRAKREKIRIWLEGLKSGRGGGDGVVEAFVAYCKDSLDTLLYPGLGPKNISEMVDYHGLEILEDALKEGKGVIFLYPHFGNEEFLMPALGHRGFNVYQVASRREPEYIKGRLYCLANYIRKKAYRMRIGTRESLPVGFAYVDKSIRDVYRVLSGNGVLLLSIDGREGRSWVDVDFLGKKAAISAGPLKLAFSTGAPVILACIVRKHRYRHTLRILKRFTPVVTGKNDEDVLSNTQRVISEFEGPILEDAPQYAKFIFHGVEIFRDGPA